MRSKRRINLVELEAAVRKWQPRLHLSDWQIGVEIGPVGKVNQARVRITWSDQTALIRFPGNFLQLDHELLQAFGYSDDRLIDYTVVHELLHIHEYPYSSHAREETDWAFGKPGDKVLAGELYNTSIRSYAEQWVSRVARILVEADHGAWLPRSVYES